MILKLILVAVITVVAFSATAQNNSDEITLIKSVYGMEKRDLIAKHIKIDASKSVLFWQMYDEYEIARKELSDRRINNIVAYANKYENLRNSDADLLLKESMEIQINFIKLWDLTYRKMAKLLSPVAAAQFIQAEMFFENMVRQELALEIPMIGEFDVKK
jgi:hypothetical protein